jgi:hypothetical protein
MKTFFVVTLMVFINILAGTAQSQSTQPPSLAYGWKHSMVAGLTLTQVAFTDWAQGGENALSYTLSSDGKSIDDESTSNWTNTYKFAFGQTRLGDQGLRKTDDFIDLSTVFTYKLGSFINPYAAATMKTQFAKGYIYNAAGNDSAISKFFDPAFLTQSVGAGYQPIKEVKTRLGLGLREVITNTFNTYTNDPTTPETEKTTVDGGIESVTNIEWQWEENILFTFQIELFAPLKTLNEVVVRNSNNITAKVNKYVTAILSVQLINEKRITPRTQVKETIALGLSYTIF